MKKFDFECYSKRTGRYEGYITVYAENEAQAKQKAKRIAEEEALVID